MSTRRDFVKAIAGAAGALAMGSELFSYAAAQAPAANAQGSRVGKIMVGGKRVKVVDVHSHWNIPGTPALDTGGRRARARGGAGAAGAPDGAPAGPAGAAAAARGARGAGAQAADAAGAAAGGRGGGRGAGGGDPVATRLAELDKRGIDLQVLSINGYGWYATQDRDLATKYVQVQDEGLSALCKSNPRFVALTSPALQFPDLAAQQVENAMKNLGLKGTSIGGHVNGESLSDPKYDPFWAKCQELQAFIFMHPGGAENVLREGAWEGSHGDLGNIVGNPIESTVFASRLIYDGTLDKFPGLKICIAHAGGFLPSYLGRADLACEVRANANCLNKKHPREYFHDQIMIDNMVFSDEGLRHLVAEMGPGQIVYGTDIPFTWPDAADEVLRANYLNNAQKEAMLGGTLMKLLKMT
jgi:aminocarboxymuconate-semialdehyde decarboxylase